MVTLARTASVLLIRLVGRKRDPVEWSVGVPRWALRLPPGCHFKVRNLSCLSSSDSSTEVRAKLTSGFQGRP